jgi:hypothetical protein
MESDVRRHCLNRQRPEAAETVPSLSKLRASLANKSITATVTAAFLRWFLYMDYIVNN